MISSVLSWSPIYITSFFCRFLLSKHHYFVISDHGKNLSCFQAYNLKWGLFKLNFVMVNCSLSEYFCIYLNRHYIIYKKQNNSIMSYSMFIIYLWGCFDQKCWNTDTKCSMCIALKPTLNFFIYYFIIFADNLNRWIHSSQKKEDKSLL